VLRSAAQRSTPKLFDDVEFPTKKFQAWLSETLESSFEADPVYFADAIKRPKWQDAMEEEYKSLIANKIWKLCKLPAGRKAIKCKWVYKTKLKPNGDVDRCFIGFAA
jgi:hypothetical protein